MQLLSIVRKLEAPGELSYFMAGFVLQTYAALSIQVLSRVAFAVADDLNVIHRPDLCKASARQMT